MLSCKGFNLTAKWSFFATSHGKQPCDGIGVNQWQSQDEKGSPAPLE